jgi:hypothetical protein
MKWLEGSEVMEKKIVLWGNPKKLSVCKICQWCFEEPAIEGKSVCQACIDATNKKEDDDFDLDKWLEEPEDET